MTCLLIGVFKNCYHISPNGPEAWLPAKMFLYTVSTSTEVTHMEWWATVVLWFTPIAYLWPTVGQGGCMYVCMYVCMLVSFMTNIHLTYIQTRTVTFAEGQGSTDTVHSEFTKIGNSQ